MSSTMTAEQSGQIADNSDLKTKYKLELSWRNIIMMSLFHTGAVYGAVLGITRAKYSTLSFTLLLHLFTALGIICGVHRYWCHRSYKAKLPLQIFLAIFQTMAFQLSIYEWCRTHRLHHKYSETDADPHNSNRGFFFSHMGWILCRKHPDVLQKRKVINVEDLDKDKLVQFQRKYYKTLVILFWGLIPTIIPYYLWGESLWNSYFICVLYRYVLISNMTWCVNSAAHMWGMRPYDKNIAPVECFIRHLMCGSGFHNYHHSFPWDYSESEYGWKEAFNPATAFIDLWEKMGLACDLKKVSGQAVQNKMMKSGDPKHKIGSPIREWLFGTLAFTSPVTLIVIFKMIHGLYSANLPCIN